MPQCPFCLGKFVKLTKEHIFPKSWYPDGNLNIEKWKVVSCEDCNHRFGEMERDLLIKLGACLDPEVILTAGIYNKALRSVNPWVGKSSYDRLSRTRKAQEILKKSFVIHTTNKKLFPGFGYHSGFPRDKQSAIAIPTFLDELGEKFIRGVEYYLEKRVIEKDYEIKVYFCHEDEIKDIIAVIRLGDYHKVAHGIEFYRLFLNGYALYEFRIWNKLIIYGSVLPSK